MLIFDKNLSTGIFIRSFKTGYVIQEPSIRVCKLEFDITEYNDDLFSTFSIEFPESLSSAVLKRRAEYLAGRISAQTLLVKEGFYKRVALCSDRSPKWPEGWNGSISHTDQCAIAVISPQLMGFAVGIDIENLIPEIIRDAADMFTTKKEQKYLIKSGIDYNIALLIAFSAKESLYKALYPTVRIFFGFECAIITDINDQYGTFTLQLTTPLANKFSAGDDFLGHFIFNKNRVTTLIY
ncbi:4'-phosphopantetheinyl transferase [Citrobacter braakii]|uniref:4'-phosphopantetheinyl transferase n=1 Tax=Citrobacter braakii TaxID=57706 RepID=UPI0037A6FE12